MRLMATRREFVRMASIAGGAVLGMGAAGALGCVRPEASAQGGGFRGPFAGARRQVEGIELRWCPPGRFTMGSPAGERGRREDEAQVEVTLTRGFWAARFEATQGEWRRLAGAFPDRPPSPEFGLGENYPMYWVSHTEAEDFCASVTARARRAGSIPAGWAFTLPTEAQWEYACRAGTTTATAFGDELSEAEASFGDTPERRAPGAAPRGARPVGSYLSNRWGIADMHGNLWEWCRDWYHARLPGGIDPERSGIPGVMNADGTHSRVRRGGAWIEEEWACRSAARLRYEPHRRSDHIGFRVFLVEI